MQQLAMAILELLEKKTSLPGKKTINRLLWVNLRNLFVSPARWWGKPLRVRRGEGWIYGGKLTAEIVANSCLVKNRISIFLSFKAPKHFLVNADWSQRTRFGQN